MKSIRELAATQDTHKSIIQTRMSKVLEEAAVRLPNYEASRTMLQHQKNKELVSSTSFSSIWDIEMDEKMRKTEM